MNVVNIEKGNVVFGSITLNGPNNNSGNPGWGSFICGSNIGGSIRLLNLTTGDSSLGAGNFGEGHYVIGDVAGTSDGEEDFDYSSSDPDENCKAANSISGSVTFSNDHVGWLEMSGNSLGGGALINNNSVVHETIELEGNTLGGGMSCSGNTSPVTNGGETNNSRGSKTGDCSGL